MSEISASIACNMHISSAGNRACQRIEELGFWRMMILFVALVWDNCSLELGTGAVEDTDKLKTWLKDGIYPVP